VIGMPIPPTGSAPVVDPWIDHDRQPEDLHGGLTLIAVLPIAMLLLTNNWSSMLGWLSK
jgi:hypothetical protein